MRVMVMVKATRNSDAGLMPGPAAGSAVLTSHGELARGRLGQKGAWPWRSPQGASRSSLVGCDGACYLKG